MDQDAKKNVISNANVNIDDLFEKISFEFICNGTHIKCQNNERWPQQWTILPDRFSIGLFEVTCKTNNFPAVTINSWQARNSGGLDK